LFLGKSSSIDNICVYLTDTGGSVKVFKHSGSEYFRGSTRNGIVSRSHSRWNGSFTIEPETGLVLKHMYFVILKNR